MYMYRSEKRPSLFTDFIKRNAALFYSPVHYSIWAAEAIPSGMNCGGSSVFLYRGCMYVCRYALHMYDKRVASSFIKLASRFVLFNRTYFLSTTKFLFFKVLFLLTNNVLDIRF